MSSEHWEWSTRGGLSLGFPFSQMTRPVVVSVTLLVDPCETISWRDIVMNCSKMNVLEIFLSLSCPTFLKGGTLPYLVHVNVTNWVDIQVFCFTFIVGIIDMKPGWQSTVSKNSFYHDFRIIICSDPTIKTGLTLVLEKIERIMRKHLNLIVIHKFFQQDSWPLILLHFLRISTQMDETDWV